jgi:hypothetical protein
MPIQVSVQEKRIVGFKNWEGVTRACHISLTEFWDEMTRPTNVRQEEDFADIMFGVYVGPTLALNTIHPGGLGWRHAGYRRAENVDEYEGIVDPAMGREPENHSNFANNVI